MLDVREKRQKAEEGRFAAAQGRLAAEQAAQAALRAEATEQHALWELAAKQVPLDLQAMQLFNEFFRLLEVREREQAERVAAAEAALAEQRACLVEAVRETEVIAKIKLRDEQAWKAEIERAEALFLDELAIMRHGRGAHPQDSAPARR